MARDMVLRITVDDSGRALVTNWGRDTEDALGRSESGFKKFRSTTMAVAKAAGVALAAIKAGLVAVASFAIKAASDFESSFAGIIKTVDDATDEFGNLTGAGEALRRGMRDLALEIPLSVNELNRIGEAAGQLGIKTENILGFTETMAKLGVTTNLASDEAATALARLANITQMPQENFERLGSTIVDLGNNFATTEREIVQFGLRVAAAGDIAGFSEADILAYGTALSSVGIEAEAGGTAIQKVINEINAAVQNGGEILDNFSRVAGMSAEEFRRAFEEDAAKAVASFIQGLDRIDAKGGNVFATLESVEFRNERVRRALLSAANAGHLLADAIDTGRRAWEENNALTREAEIRFQTFKSQWQLLKNAIMEVAIQVGDMLLPIWKDLVKDVREYVNREGPAVAQSIGVFLVEAVGFAVEALEFLVGAWGRMRQTVAEIGEFLSSVHLAGLQSERDELVKMAEGWDAAGAAAARMESTLEGTVHELGVGLQPTLEDVLARIAELDVEISETGASMREWGESAEEAASSTDRIQEMLGRAKGKLGEYKGIVIEAGAETAEMEEAVRDLDAEMAAAFDERMRGIVPLVGEFSDAVGDAGVEVEFEVGTMKEAEKAHRKHEKALRDGAKAADDFFRAIRTGVTWLDSMIEGVIRLIMSLTGNGGLAGAFQGLGGIVSGVFGQQGNTMGQLAGGLLGRIPGIAGMLGGLGGGAAAGGAAAGGAAAAGATGGGAGLGGLGLGALGGPIGLGIMGAAALGPLIFKGLKALFGNIGGPSEQEVQGRGAAGDFRSAIAGLVDASHEAEIAAAVAEGGTREWATEVVVLRDAYLAMGRTEQEALEISQRLWAAEKEGPEAVAAVIAEIQPILDAVQEGMADAGVGLQEFRDKMINETLAAAEASASTVEDAIAATEQMYEDAMRVAEKATADAAAAIGTEHEGAAQAAADAAMDAAAIWAQEMERLKDEAAGAADTIRDEIAGAFNFTNPRFAGDGGGLDVSIDMDVKFSGGDDLTDALANNLSSRERRMNAAMRTGE